MRHSRLENAGDGPAGPMLHYASGTSLFGEGDGADDLFKIVSGLVRTCRFTSDGRRVIDAFHTCGDVLGFEVDGLHSLAAEAVCDCTVIFYSGWRLRTLIGMDGDVSGQFLSHALRSLARSQRHARLLAKRSAPCKIAAFLMERSERSIDRSEVDLPMTRQDIADYVGLTIETVSRTFTQLERDRLIDLRTPRRIHIRDLPALLGLDC